MQKGLHGPVHHTLNSSQDTYTQTHAHTKNTHTHTHTHGRWVRIRRGTRTHTIWVRDTRIGTNKQRETAGCCILQQEHVSTSYFLFSVFLPFLRLRGLGSTRKAHSQEVEKKKDALRIPIKHWEKKKLLSHINYFLLSKKKNNNQRSSFCAHATILSSVIDSDTSFSFSSFVSLPQRYHSPADVSSPNIPQVDKYKMTGSHTYKINNNTQSTGKVEETNQSVLHGGTGCSKVLISTRK